MTELEALRRVAEAARAVARVPNLDGRIIEALRHHLDALDTLPAPAEPEGVAPLRAVSVAITQPSAETSWAMHVVMSDGSLWEFCQNRWTPSPLPPVPEVVGEVG